MAVVLAVALVGLAVAVHENRLILFDVRWALSIQEASIGSRFVLARALSALGRAPIWDLAIALVAGFLLATGRGNAGRLLLAGIISAEILTTLTKVVVGGLGALDLSVFDILESAGFPSGHVVRVSVGGGLVVALCAWRTRWRWPSVALASLLALAIGWARIAVKSHVPSDVLAAFLLAGLVIDLVLLFCQAPPADRAPGGLSGRGQPG